MLQSKLDTHLPAGAGRARGDQSEVANAFLGLGIYLRLRSSVVKWRNIPEAIAVGSYERELTIGTMRST